MIPTQLGQSSYYNQYMRSQRGSSPRHGGAGTNGGGSNGGGLRERLLTDRDSYLQHLEEQIDKVSSACLLADELKAKHQELHLRVDEVEEKLGDSTKTSQLNHKVVADQCEGHTQALEQVQGRLKALEGLTDRVASGEVENARGFKSMMDRMDAMEDRISRWQQDQEAARRIQDERIARVLNQAHDLSVSQQRLEEQQRSLELRMKEMGADLEHKHSLLGVEVRDEMERIKTVDLAKGLKQVQMISDRGLIDVRKDMGHVRHELGLTENRMLAALAKQAALGHEQVSQLQELVQDMLVADAGPSSFSKHRPHESLTEGTTTTVPRLQITSSSSNGPLASSSTEVNPGEAGSMDLTQLSRRVDMLKAAVCHHEEVSRQGVAGCREGLDSLRCTLDVVQQAMEAMTNRTLDFARSQAQEVMRSLEPVDERLAMVEDKVASASEPSPHVENLREELRRLQDQVKECMEGHTSLVEQAQHLNQDLLAIKQSDDQDHNCSTNKSDTNDLAALARVCRSLHQAQSDHSKQITELRKQLADITTALHQAPDPPAPIQPSPTSSAPLPSSPVMALGALESPPPQISHPIRPHHHHHGRGSPSPIAERAHKKIVRSPIHPSARAGALQALQVMEGLAIEEARDATLKEAIREVADLFAAINKSERMGHRGCLEVPGTAITGHITTKRTKSPRHHHQAVNAAATTTTSTTAGASTKSDTTKKRSRSVRGGSCGSSSSGRGRGSDPCLRGPN